MAQVLTDDTVRQLRTSLPLALLLINSRLAVSLAEQGNTAEAARHVQIIGNSGFDQHHADEAFRIAVEPIRGRIKTICQEAETEAQADPVHANRTSESLLCSAVPLLQVLDTVLPAGNPIAEGCRDEVALTALSCQVAFGNKTEDWRTSARLLEQILDIAASESARTRIEENLRIVRSNLEAGTDWCGPRYWELPPPWRDQLESAREQARERHWPEAIAILEPLADPAGVNKPLAEFSNMLSCPHCKGKVLYDPKLAGKIAGCPYRKCQRRFRVPSEEPKSAVICPHCAETVRYNPAQAGRSTECPYCDQRFLMPEAHAEANSEEERARQTARRLARKAMAYCLNGACVDRLNTAMDEYNQPLPILQKIADNPLHFLGEGLFIYCAACGGRIIGEYVQITYNQVRINLCPACGAEAKRQRQKKEERLAAVLETVLNDLRRARELDPNNQAVETNLAEARKIAAQLEVPVRNSADPQPCFIATAAYGSPLSDEVDCLRRFRDQVLRQSRFGRVLVTIYYRLSPSLAARLHKAPTAKKAVRRILGLVLWHCRRVLAADELSNGEE